MRTIRSFQIKDFRVNAMVVYVKRCFYLGKHSSLSSSVLQPFKEITCFGSTVMGVMGQWYVNCNFGSLFSFLGWRIYCPLFASHVFISLCITLVLINKTIGKNSNIHSFMELQTVKRFTLYQDC